MEQHCRILADSVNLRQIRAGRSIALGNFTGAVQHLNKACELIASGRSVIFQTILPGIPLKNTAVLQITSKDDRSTHAIAGGAYEEAVRKMDENDRDYKRHELGMLVLKRCLHTILSVGGTIHTWPKVQHLLPQEENTKEAYAI